MTRRAMYTPLRTLGVLVAVTLVAAGCAGSSAHVRIEPGFPTVVAQPREIHAAVVFQQPFRDFVAQTDAKTSIDIGAAQVELLGNAFRGLFSRVDIVSAREQLAPGTELVIIPSVREVQLSSPSESYLNVFEVWIKYALEIETGEGVPIDTWFLPAYGKTQDSMLTSRSEGIEEAAIVALRDAGAKLLLDFYRIPAIHGWFERERQTG
ncbi:MAG: hypothetical protein GTN86_01140 [Xanthomonadales bacterium]|nr:hypothetical protein [Xanthomonadales bacterium]NIN58419.1 hypothetical protein [Xanthomonadales bacterium]NIN73756.1 hypothetical protein [Xanthomonadales bacterium]NIO13726.1 hypothetical protein [Xanthomonadales bacterium]NIP10812.1 hypothetical protein [Xanthomonadales bacterium]